MKLIYGKGINDSTEPVTYKVNGKMYKTKIYSIWHHMLERCYSEKSQSKYPSYIGCTVCEEWLTFSNFKKWVETQDYENNELDKDLLIQGNKVYSPDTCIFVSDQINNFLKIRANYRGNYPLGVSKYEYNRNKKGTVKSSISINGKLHHLGYFDNIIEAHQAWQVKKIEHAQILIESCTNEKIISGLMRIIQQIKNNIEHGEETTKL